MNLEEMRMRKEELGYTSEMIAERSGIPLSTVQKIFAGVTKRPRYDTLLALEEVLNPQSSMVYEAEFSYRPWGNTAGGGKRQGQYTLEDYEALTKGVPAELIDGVIIRMDAPSTIHQIVSLKMYRIFTEHIQRHGGECVAFAAPCGVQLKEESDDFFIPDVLVVCDRSKINRKRIVGAPDLIVEVTSPSTSERDTNEKMYKYMEAGVREYWIVNPLTLHVVVHRKREDCIHTHLYGFTDRIPSEIFSSPCEVDMAAVYEEARFLYELPYEEEDENGED